MSQPSIVWRLLRRNISAGQIAGFAAANLVGMIIVLTALQFYRDVTSVINTEDNMLTQDYIVLSRKVKDVSFGKSTGFSVADIADIEKQPWVKRVAPFTASRFHVTGKIDLGSGMYTHLFFESIPDDYFDTLPPDWSFDPEEENPTIPIVLSRDYLALYNFGFAATRGLPQFSEELISELELKVSVSGNGLERTFPGRVVGFSNRLNTISAPQAFVEWANGIYAVDKEEDPMRLIVQVTDPGDPVIKAYLEEHGMESAGDKLESGKAAHFFTIATTVVVGVGVIICLLSFFILMLSVYLLIQKNRQKIHDLILLGYTPGQVSKYYIRLSVITNVSVLLLSCITVFVAQQLWLEPVRTIGSEVASLIPTYIVGLIMVLVIIGFNVAAIKRLTRRSV
ncbi:MAG: ABC transporter permease [Muribaculaceae bacterium]|nr:ABC transporter permease [Muribaculaceae bacterium]